jgi:hypothetical protein
MASAFSLRSWDRTRSPSGSCAKCSISSSRIKRRFEGVHPQLGKELAGSERTALLLLQFGDGIIRIALPLAAEA